MTREEYVALPRQWIGTVRYPLSDESIRVALIARYSPGCVELAGYPRMSASSGPKDYLKNQIHEALKVSGADELLLVRGRGPMFALLRKGPYWYDMEPKRIELTLERGDAAGDYNKSAGRA